MRVHPDDKRPDVDGPVIWDSLAPRREISPLEQRLAEVVALGILNRQSPAAIAADLMPVVEEYVEDKVDTATEAAYAVCERD